jgi:ribosomal protein L1
MPNPKAGCVVPPKGNVPSVVEKLQSLVRLKTAKSPVLHVTVGNEDLKDEDLIKNITSIIDQIIHHLPKEASNIKAINLKLTMSKPLKLDK